MNLITKIYQAQQNIARVTVETPLIKNLNLSGLYQADIYLKREDLQPVRSYKLRGAYNKISTLTPEQQATGVVCASAGNHAQGVAFSCNQLGIHATIFMPITTPKQKIDQVKLFGKEMVEIVLKGDTFDACFVEAKAFCDLSKAVLIHPFDDEQVIAGQGTVGLEVLQMIKQPIDYIFVPIGGGGLAAGVSTVFKQLSPQTKVIGVEPQGAASMQLSMVNKVNTTLSSVDTFVDGAAVKRVGELTFEICKENLHEVLTVAEGKVCTTILKLYNEEALVVEPAGALSIAALDLYKEHLVGKRVVCVVSGSNNDITRTEEIKERSLLHEGLKHYFIVNFPQRPGALKEFVNQVLGDNDDITYFQFAKKTNREKGPAVVGVELANKDDYKRLIKQLDAHAFNYQYLNDNQALFTHIVG
ncbi:threonine ammonia-lyase IlvA [Myroides pelagicus]|uniref:L-threonine dehydratase n=1 Tax=Myroides pelagicus TaxID=270914 RepID=A0A7K1GM08_9FLAO|nr:threonine ammonia-lyase IlvA [Myroides pelagicus]MTH29925.1 threonine ammonia-lyase IlvA [Myroides pelagicus]